MPTNRRILLARRPDGLVTDADFEVVEEPVAPLAEGDALVRVLALSVDPTNRVWMREQDSYLPAIELGAVVRAAGIGTVVESKLDGFATGDLVTGLCGWQDYWTVTADSTANVLPAGLPVEDLLSIYGVTGITAYIGMLDVCELREGDAVVVSGAAGGVGSVAGQIARIKGASRVVGTAGTPEKCKWVVDELGFDACINYRSEAVGERLEELFPDGIDVYFDNVGGPTLDAVLANLAIGARIGLCGAISAYTRSTPLPVYNTPTLVMQRGRMRGFIILDHLDRFPDAVMELVGWVAEGRIKYRVEVVDGLERAPETLNRLFTGEHDGKLVVRVAES
ncbi:MAG TPA: NADP-dependent oxidoreductase [Acidimicrobiia bacterium]